MSVQVASAGRPGLPQVIARWVEAHYRPLETPREKAAAKVAAIVALLALALLIGPRATGGRFGVLARSIHEGGGRGLDR
jgi:hypothetical protein